MLVLLFLLQALPAAWSSYDVSCRTIADSRCDFLFSANVSSLHSDRIVIDIDRGQDYLRLLSNQNDCWTSEKSRLLVKLDETSSNCHSFKVGEKAQVVLSTININDDPVRMQRRNVSREEEVTARICNRPTRYVVAAPCCRQGLQQEQQDEHRYSTTASNELCWNVACILWLL